ncbi:hypothetical protein BDY24DRAFT_377678 [Mrakia frigida]|uniref:transcription factor TFIIIB subunit BRF1 n=1 Tax=Mrakia frigida TaxID=29902 RepID=UPI003FCC0126
MARRCVACNSSVINIDSSAGGSYCGGCGIVLEENTIVSEITFGETSGGAAMVQGSYVSADATRAHTSGPYNRGSQESKEQAIANGKKRIRQLAQGLKLSERLSDAAQRWFNLAVSTNFIKGRRSGYVIAACLYITCRMEKTSHMLIDFSDMLQVNVFVLGSTYLKLVKTLNITIPIMDPSLYISRFAALLEFKEETQKVATDAVRLVQRFNRDWMATGRRPAGICGACLLLAARMNNFRRSIQEIVQVVKIADTTVQKRLDEFKATQSGALTIQDFRTTWEAKEENPPAFTAAHKVKEVRVPKGKGKGKGKGKERAVDEPMEEEDEEVEPIEEPIEYVGGPSTSLIGTPNARLDKGKGRETPRRPLNALDAEGSPSVGPSTPANENDAVFRTAADFDAEEDEEGNEKDDDDEEEGEGEDFTAQMRAIDPGLRDSPGASSSVVGRSSPPPDTQPIRPSSSFDASRSQQPPASSSQHVASQQASTSARPISSKPSQPPSNVNENETNDEDEDEIALAIRDEVTEQLESAQGAELLGELNDADRRAAERRAMEIEGRELEGLDEDELDQFIMTDEEVRVKTRLWMEFNKEYLQKLAVKQAKAQGDPDAQDAAKKKRKRKDGATGPVSVRGATPAESARNLATQKKFSKKINYKAFETLFDNSDLPQRMSSRQLRDSTIPRGSEVGENEKEDGAGEASESGVGGGGDGSDGEKEDESNEKHDEMHEEDGSDDDDAPPPSKKGRSDAQHDPDFLTLSSSFARGGDDDDDGFEEV